MREKRPNVWLRRGALMLALSLPAAIAVPMPFQENDINRAESQRFTDFLNSHPQVQKDLNEKPSLIDDPAYMASHPELRGFLQTHPGVRDEIKENPSAFMRQDRALNRGEVRNVDNFLDTHPEMREELGKNPRLVDNQQYLASHPELREFLNNHPGAAKQGKQHPKVMQGKERNLERHEPAPRR